MGYIEDDSFVRVDFFKPSGKWYCTESVKWLDYGEKLIHEAFAEALLEHFRACGNPEEPWVYLKFASETEAFAWFGIDR